MALKKTAGATAGTAKKTAAKGTAKTAAPEEGCGRNRDQEGGPQEGRRPQALPAPDELLKKLAGHTDPAGYHAEKKPENKSLETLLKHKLVKKGKKHPKSGHYHYTISKAGQKHLASTPAPSSSAPKSS